MTDYKYIKKSCIFIVLKNKELKITLSIPELYTLIESLQQELQELKALLTDIQRDNAALREENANLRAENTELRSRLNLNSINSSKPPSTDGYKKKPAFPRKKNGKKGGKKGHTGKTLLQVEKPDIIIEHKPDECSCGCQLTATPAYLVEKRQVFDLPEPRLEVTEHQLFETVCPHCQKVNRAQSPQGVNSPVQYGNGVKALTTLLFVCFKLPFKKIRLLFDDLFGYPINESTIYTSNRDCYNKLEATEKIIQEKIINSAVANADETGLRVAGVLHWLHSISTNLFTYLFVHQKRGKKALESEQSIISHFFGWLVHDCWSSYFNFTHLKHAVCNAHIVREFQALIETDIKWAGTFKTLLLNIYQMPFEQRLAQQKHLEARYDKICKIADSIEPPPKKPPGKKGKTKRTKGRNLLERMIKHKSAVLAFAFNEHVPFTNNLAERDVRPAKVKQKISGCFRTKEGADTYARIEGYISSARKNQLNIFKELKNTFEGYNYFTEYHYAAK